MAEYEPVEPGLNEPFWQRLFRRGPYLAALGFIFFFLAGLTAAALLYDPSLIGRAEQPIAFSHRRHVAELELECVGCHEFYEEETFSGFPKAEICALCHGAAQGESLEEAKLVQLLEEGRPLEWESLFRQPAHVFFTHRRHVVSAQLECSVCHGDIASSEAPPESVKLLSMEECIACHERGEVTNRCAACHR